MDRLAQPGRKDGRFHTSQSPPADARVGIRAQNGRGGVLIITRIVVRLEAIGAAAALADVRFVGYFPVANAGTALLAVAHEVENEFLPFAVVARLDEVVIDLGKQHARFEANAHQRLRARSQDGVHRPVQCFKMIAVVFRQKVEILLNEQPDERRLQRANLGNPILPHRLVGKSALAQGHFVDFERSEGIPEVHVDVRRVRLRSGAKNARA